MRASRASDAAGGVAGGSDRGSTVEVEAGGSGGPLSLFNGRVRGLGGQPRGRGSTRRRRTVGPSRGPFARRAYWIDPDGLTPVGGTEASWTLSSTLAPEGRVVLTTRSRTTTHHRHPPRSSRVHTPSPSPLSSLPLSPLSLSPLLVCAVCLTQALILPMRDCVWAAPRGPCAIRWVGSLCPGGVRCGVSL